MRRFGFWAFVGGVVFALLPLVSATLAYSLAGLGGCELNESGTNPCMLLGLDWGGLLSMMAIAGWLAFFTLPWGGLVALVGLVVYVAARILKK